jgi:hypothetical protein
MKIRNILINGLLVAATVFLFGCVSGNTETASDFGNQAWFDVTYTFNKAYINGIDPMKDTPIKVKVKSWQEYEGSDAIQIIAEDGTVYYTSLHNVVLVNE